MKQNTVIQVVLSDAGEASVIMDGKETHSEKINSEEEFVEFLGIVFEEYAWWIGEAWRGHLEDIENKANWTDEDDDDDDAA